MPDHRINDRTAKFIIWASSFSETDGGAIALHLLCHRLNEAGETAMVWPADRPLVRFPFSLRMMWRTLRYALAGRHQTYSTGPFGNRLASRRDIAGSIVVYPEIVAGNPLGGERVVRWFLHKPGHFTGIVDYGADELYFYIVDVFNDNHINTNLDNILNLKWMNDVYADEGVTDREGSCYLMKKGAGREIVHDLQDSTFIDILTPRQKAEEFNRRRYFYCYDPYTMYYMYAAICGCIPIVVPEPGKSKLDWHPKEVDRLGVAYGDEDVPWAIETREKLLDRLRGGREAEDRMLQAFIRKCKAWYDDK